MGSGGACAAEAGGGVRDCCLSFGDAPRFVSSFSFVCFVWAVRAAAQNVLPVLPIRRLRRRRLCLRCVATTPLSRLSTARRPWPTRRRRQAPCSTTLLTTPRCRRAASWHFPPLLKILPSLLNCHRLLQHRRCSFAPRWWALLSTWKRWALRRRAASQTRPRASRAQTSPPRLPRRRRPTRRIRTTPRCASCARCGASLPPRTYQKCRFSQSPRLLRSQCAHHKGPSTHPRPLTRVWLVRPLSRRSKRSPPRLRSRGARRPPRGCCPTCETRRPGSNRMTPLSASWPPPPRCWR